MEKETLNTKIIELKRIIDGTKKGVLFTGAGISVPSGIPDFRSAGGLYSTPYGNYSAEYMLSHTFFISHGEEFYKFYKDKMLYPDAKPNAAHIFFAELEKEGKLAATVTQNIDGLHQAAGAEKVYELHGSVHRNYCMTCGKRFDLDYVIKADGAPRCDACGGRVRPEVVLYEEGLDNDVVNGAVKTIAHADTLFIVGTSLAVYPAAGLINYFNGEHLVLINKTPNAFDGGAFAIYDDVERVVNEIKELR